LVSTDAIVYLLDFFLAGYVTLVEPRVSGNNLHGGSLFGVNLKHLYDEIKDTPIVFKVVDIELLAIAHGVL